MTELTRPIIGIENRTPQEVFDIMCDRLTRALSPSPAEDASVELTARLPLSGAAYRSAFDEELTSFGHMLIDAKLLTATETRDGDGWKVTFALTRRPADDEVKRPDWFAGDEDCDGNPLPANNVREAKLRDAIEKARTVLSETPELNMSNYSEDDVADLNAGMIEVYKILDAAVAGELA